MLLCSAGFFIKGALSAFFPLLFSHKSRMLRCLSKQIPLVSMEHTCREGIKIPNLFCLRKHYAFDRVKSLDDILATAEEKSLCIARWVALQLTMLGISAIIGTGIFVLTAAAAQKAGLAA